MSESRKEILAMLAEGKITADEAERLIAAMERTPQGAVAAGEPAVSRKPLPKYLRVVVEAEEDPGSDTLTKVNIRVPFQLLRAGVKLANFMPPRARAEVNEALRKQGIDFDVAQIKPENLDELIEQLNDLVVDIDSDRRRAKVKIFCE
jgi:hypothetical protein